MFIGPLSYEFYLLRYADIYLLLGIFELGLRRKIPVALSNHAQANGYSEWFDLVTKNNMNRAVIKKALESNSQKISGLEDYLPLSFWSYMFRREFYSVLWTPCLYQVFTGLNNPLSRDSFLMLAQRMRRATRIRNRVAHFNLVNSGNYDEEVDVLRWLINAMDKPMLS